MPAIVVRAGATPRGGTAALGTMGRGLGRWMGCRRRAMGVRPCADLPPRRLPGAAWGCGAGRVVRARRGERCSQHGEASDDECDAEAKCDRDADHRAGRERCAGRRACAERVRRGVSGCGVAGSGVCGVRMREARVRMASIHVWPCSAQAWCVCVRRARRDGRGERGADEHRAPGHASKSSHVTHTSGRGCPLPTNYGYGAPLAYCCLARAAGGHPFSAQLARGVRRGGADVCGADGHVPA